jgi:hypothetical protein
MIPGSTEDLGRARCAWAIAAIVLAAGAGLRASAATPQGGGEPPELLSGTGLYADFASRTIAPENLPFSPQYPLWSDGATKRRWIRIPAGSAIDATDPDAWDFPVGTRIWKEFTFDRPVETRYIERLPSGEWLFATYRWSEDGTEARLVPELGAWRVARIAEGKDHNLPSRWDCRACHEGNVSRVLGFSALQLSSDRDPGAPHAEALPAGAIDLAGLVARGMIRGLPPEIAAGAPRVPAASPTERAARGYLHANCGQCHNDRGALAADLGLTLEVRLAGAGSGARAAIADAIDRVAHFQPGGVESKVLVAGQPESSLLYLRMATRDPLAQMPPLGTQLVDRDALARVGAWIRELRERPKLAAAHVPAAQLTPTEEIPE